MIVFSIDCDKSLLKNIYEVDIGKEKNIYYFWLEKKTFAIKKNY